MFFPWIQTYDRLRGRFEASRRRRRPPACSRGSRPPSRSGRAAEADDGPLRPGLRPLCAVPEEWRLRLANAGINSLQAVRARRSIGARTLAASRASSPDWRYLGLRRLALFVVDSIERGTRWVLFEQPGPGAVVADRTAGR